jgi:putative hydrolase
MAVEEPRAYGDVNDGDSARQDLGYTLGRHALRCGCLFALDSDAHTTAQLSYAEPALAHARLAAIPVDRIVNCWPLERLLAWLANPFSECRP